MDFYKILKSPSEIFEQLNEVHNGTEANLSKSDKLKNICGAIHNQDETVQKTLSKTVSSQAAYYKLHEVLYKNTTYKDFDFTPQNADYNMAKQALSNLQAHTEVYAFITVLYETKDVEEAMDRINFLIDEKYIENKMTKKISLMHDAISVAKEDNLTLKNVDEFEQHVNGYYTNIVKSFNKPKE